MLIIAGKLYVAPEHREEYVASHEDFVRRARAYPGCLDLAITADPIEAGRVNMFERWTSEERLASSRAVAGAPAPVTEVRDGDVALHDISASRPPFP